MLGADAESAIVDLSDEDDIRSSPVARRPRSASRQRTSTGSTSSTRSNRQRRVSAERERERERQRAAAVKVVDGCRALFDRHLRRHFSLDQAGYGASGSGAVDISHDQIDKRADVAGPNTPILSLPDNSVAQMQSADTDARPPSPARTDSGGKPTARVEQYIELWDDNDPTASSLRFLGFVAERNAPDSATSTKRDLYLFFDKHLVQTHIKSSTLMALLEFADSAPVSCQRLVVCLDRLHGGDESELADKVKALGFVGFEQIEGLESLDDGDEPLSDGVNDKGSIHACRGVEDTGRRDLSDQVGASNHEWLFMALDI